jgi:predicted GIY-YIG superfamily endonuclease
MFKIYKLVNRDGIIEYIGRTTSPEYRLYQHTHKGGKFVGRTDLELKVITEFNSIKEANLYEGQLKIKLGFEWTEIKRSQKGGSITGKKFGKINGIIHNSKAVLVFDKNNNFIGEYYSAIEASRILNLPQASVNRVVNNKQNLTKGYKIKYK